MSILLTAAREEAPRWTVLPRSTLVLPPPLKRKQGIHSFIHSFIGTQFLGTSSILDLHRVKGKRFLLQRQAEGMGRVTHRSVLNACQLNEGALRSPTGP